MSCFNEKSDLQYFLKMTSLGMQRNEIISILFWIVSSCVLCIYFRYVACDFVLCYFISSRILWFFCKIVACGFVLCYLNWSIIVWFYFKIKSYSLFCVTVFKSIILDIISFKVIWLYVFVWFYLKYSVILFYLKWYDMF